MAVKKVLKMGNPLLRRKAEPIPPEEIRTDKFQNLIQDLFDTMDEQEGIGIAAPQIGISQQVAIVGVPKENTRYPDLEEEEEFEALVVINPQITVLDEEPIGFWEGCLSVPGLRGYVERPQKIRVDFLNLEGGQESLEVSGFPAVVFQHEIDHLDGVLYIDRVSDKSKISYLEEYEEFHSEGDDVD